MQKHMSTGQAPICYTLIRLKTASSRYIRTALARRTLRSGRRTYSRVTWRDWALDMRSCRGLNWHFITNGEHVCATNEADERPPRKTEVSGVGLGRVILPFHLLLFICCFFFACLLTYLLNSNLLLFSISVSLRSVVIPYVSLFFLCAFLPEINFMEGWNNLHTHIHT